jgi:hypothetical protein
MMGGAVAAAWKRDHEIEAARVEHDDVVASSCPFAVTLPFFLRDRYFFPCPTSETPQRTARLSAYPATHEAPFRDRLISRRGPPSF